MWIENPRCTYLQTFREKKKNIAEGTTRFDLHKRANASLHSGIDLKQVVKLPPDEEVNDWIAVHGNFKLLYEAPSSQYFCSYIFIYWNLEYIATWSGDDCLCRFLVYKPSRNYLLTLWHVGMLSPGKSHSWVESGNSRVLIETLDCARVRIFYWRDRSWIAGKGANGGDDRRPAPDTVPGWCWDPITACRRST